VVTFVKRFEARTRGFPSKEKCNHETSSEFVVRSSLKNTVSRATMPALSRHDNDAVLHEGDLTNLSPDSLFLAKKVPEDDLPPFRADMVHRLQEELLFIVVQHIGLEIAHA
jgi:hypothetical protein